MPLDRFSTREVLLLTAVAAVNLLGILDTTIVTAAIPSAAAELSIAPADRQWIVTAYALGLASVLLVGGRVADFWGRKRALLLGLIAFSLASMLGGLAQTGIELLAARAVQGASAALMAPASLSIVTVAFPAGRLRAIAFGVLGGIASSGAAVGLVAGGLLTEWVGWRWSLFVNVPVALGAIALVAVILRDAPAKKAPVFDIFGALVIAAGLAVTTLGLARWEADPVTGAVVVVFGICLIGLFVWIEQRARTPILPLSIVVDRARGGALLIQICSGTAMAGVTLYLTLHLQQVMLWGPLSSGVAMLPLAIGIAVGIPVFVRATMRIGLRGTLVIAPLIASAGIGLLSLISEDGSYALDVLPGLTLMGVGMSGVFVAAQNLALSNVLPDDAGAASAASQAANQVGGAIGLALLTNIFLVFASDQGVAADLVDGFAAVFIAASGAMLVAATIAFVVVPRAAPALRR